MSDLSDLPGDLKGLHISLNHLLESCKELRCSTLEIFQDFHELLVKCSENCKYLLYSIHEHTSTCLRRIHGLLCFFQMINMQYILRIS